MQVHGFGANYNYETRKLNMNKKEAKQRIHNLEEELAELKHLLDQPEGRWRAEEGGLFYRLYGSGGIHSETETGCDYCDQLHFTGNYFQTEEQAKASNIYKILNSEYEYYFAVVSDHFDDIPRDGSVEYYDCYSYSWHYCSASCIYQTNNYRWKK